jgi:hypothetical protein
MHEDIRTSQPEQFSSTAQAPPLPSQADIEATLRDLLIRFRDTAKQDSEQIAIRSTSASARGRSQQHVVLITLRGFIVVI